MSDKDQFASEIVAHVLDADPAAIYHVLPTDDAMEHREGLDCPCAPKLLRVPPTGAVVVHNAWDGREAFEGLS